MDATASDRVLRERRRPHGGGAPGHDDLRRGAADGRRHPHALQLPRPARPTARAASAWSRSTRRAAASWWPRAATRSRAASSSTRKPKMSSRRGRSSWNCSWPRRPTPASWPTFAAGLGVESTPFEKAAEGKCILCGLCARVCNEMMGRGAINLFGRGESREVRTAFDEQTQQCQACGACALRLPDGRRRPGHDHRAAAEAAPHGVRQVPDRPALHRPGPSPGLAAGAGRSTATTASISRPGECGLCAKVCQAGAIDYDQPAETLELEVGSVVLTPGFEAFDATRRGEFGFGLRPQRADQRAVRADALGLRPHAAATSAAPADGKAPQRLAFIQCVGSRDSGCDNDYCSSVCCMAATKEAILAKEHEPGLDVTIFFLDLRAFGKDFDRYCDRAKKQLGVRYVRSFISRDLRNARHAQPPPGLCQPRDEAGRGGVRHGRALAGPGAQRQPAGAGPAAGRGAEPLGLRRRPTSSARWTPRGPACSWAGRFQEPKDIPDTVMQASAAAARAMALLATARGSRVRTKTYPPERDIADEPPRIGVFVCHCGSNIASVVDVERVVERTRQLPGVVLAETQRLHLRRRQPGPHQGQDRRASAEPGGGRLLHAADPRADLPRHAPRCRAQSLPAGDGQHPRPMLLGPLGRSRTRPPRRRSTWSAWPSARAARARPLQRRDRAGQQRGPGGRRRHRRHDGRPGPGRARLPRPPGREKRPPGRHGLPDPPHA